MREDPVDLDGLRRLQSDAQRIAAGLGRMGDPQTRVEGWDGSRTVRVTMDGSGRLVDAEVGQAWRNTLGSSALGPAVIEAIGRADEERMAEWAYATRRAADEAGEPVDLAGATVGPAGDRVRTGAAADGAVLESSRELYYLAMDAIDRLAELSRAIEPAPAGAARVRSRSGLVTVTVEDGRVTAVDLDLSWLRDATAVEIAEQLRAAFRAAEQAGPQAAAAAALDHPTFRELRDVSKDPRELMRRLGAG